MKAKLLFLASCLLAFSNANSTIVNESQAVQLVKQVRNTTGKDTANYYIATVNKMIDDYPYTLPTIISNPTDIASKLAFNSIPTVDLLQPGVDQEVHIESVSPNPSVSTINVRLSAKATSGSSLVVTNINDSKTVGTVQLTEGDDAASLSLDGASAGNYAVSLLINGKVVSSK